MPIDIQLAAPPGAQSGTPAKGAAAATGSARSPSFGDILQQLPPRAGASAVPAQPLQGPAPATATPLAQGLSGAGILLAATLPQGAAPAADAALPEGLGALLAGGKDALSLSTPSARGGPRTGPDGGAGEPAGSLAGVGAGALEEMLEGGLEEVRGEGLEEPATAAADSVPLPGQPALMPLAATPGTAPPPARIGQPAEANAVAAMAAGQSASAPAVATASAAAQPAAPLAGAPAIPAATPDTNPGTSASALAGAGPAQSHYIPESSSLPADPAPAAARMSAALDSSQWRHDLGRHMAALVRHGDQRVSLHLNPAELGPLVVDLKVSEQQAQMQFLSAHAQVRHAVEQAIPQLREALAEQGISLGETMVGGQHTERRDSGEGAGGEGGRRAAAGSAASANTAAPEPARVPLEHDGRVNLYI